MLVNSQTKTCALMFKARACSRQVDPVGNFKPSQTTILNSAQGDMRTPFGRNMQCFCIYGTGNRVAVAAVYRWPL